ncbi:MAG: hypothetical protein OXU23_19850 [Candidatus Poribacteria bacterium]|nr:hypothetical protein [Candidatus Poribacteria bacterium]
MASFDAASKKQVETNPQDFVHLCFKFGLTDTTVLEVVTPEQPTVEMYQADILIKALDNGREMLVHFEFQTTDSYDPEMPLQMAGYIIRAIEVHRLPVYSNVIYLRPDAGRNDPGKFEQNLENHNISIEYQVLRLIEIDGQEILDLKSVGLIPFTPLMKRPADLDSEQWLRRCIQAADSIDVVNKPEYLGSLAILGNLVYDSQTILDIISEETMQQPPIVEYVAPQAREQGAKETTRKHILEVLKLRLQFDATQTFKSTLEAIDDLQHLEQLFSTAMQVKTQEDFMQALNENSE